ncbi:MAG: DegV family protein, partial [Acidimicrobiales bacterium]
VLPETSAPSPGAFAEQFRSLGAGGAGGVLCVTLSSKLSATYQAAVTAAEAVRDQVEVRVLDSLSVTMGEGLCALAAADAAERGDDLEGVAAAAEATRATTQVFGALDTLDNLKKGGRVGGAQALVGSLLSIKPVIAVRDGLVEPESRQRTRSRSLDYLAGKLEGDWQIRRLAVVHAAAPDVGAFVEGLSSRYGEISVSYIGPVIGSHAGPGTIGVCFETKEA